MKLISQSLLVAASLLAGCASHGPTYTPQQLAHGVKLAAYHADIYMSPKCSRPTNVAHVFEIPIRDVDPEKYLLNAQQNVAYQGFIEGTAQAGLAGGVLNAAIGTAVMSAGEVRGQYDEWNAILDASKFATIYEGSMFALREVAHLTKEALTKQGYDVTVEKRPLDEDDVVQGITVKYVLTLVNEEKGCIKPTTQDDDACRVVVRRMYTSATREKAPIWLVDVKDAFVIRSLGVWPDGKTSEGQVFKLNREDREAIGRASKEGFYFYGAFDGGHAAFVGENGKVEYCHLPPEILAKSRERDEKGFFVRMKEAAQKNIEKHGWGVLVDTERLLEEEEL